jgi:hypothetical protein
MTSPERVVAALERLALTPAERDDAAALLAVYAGDDALFTHAVVGPKVAALVARLGVTAQTPPDDVPKIFEKGVAADARLSQIAAVLRDLADDAKRAPELAGTASRKLLGIETANVIEKPAEGGTKASPLARFTLQVPKKD